MGLKSDDFIKEEEEKFLLEALSERKKLQSDFELAKGITYTDPIQTR